MDGRIGIIQRGGKQVFYGLLNDRFESLIERETPEEVLDVLDGRVAPIRFKPGTQVRREKRDYIVHVIPKNPACDERGWDFEIEAVNQKEAISMARRRVSSQCTYLRSDGPLVYTARRK